ncbi:nucleotidyltransferase [Desulfosarcina variabilis str. Montpellier]|uniref:nucleotidyltransferase domain-containing protein n=1 Tax=Desulfosarcina variabilis TaxID=2300 RepID=UPI003AFAEB20
MRISKSQAAFLKQRIQNKLPDADVYLFGSRTNNQLKGGDIDIFVESEKKLTFQQIRDVKISFYKRFGEQRLDIVSVVRNATSTFRDLVLLEAIKL